MRPNWSGNQIATVSLPEHMATNMVMRGRTRIGLVYCRVRLHSPKIIRCFRCHCYGHRATGCKLNDRSANCMTCRGPGHLSKECKEPPNCFLCEEMKKKKDHFPEIGKCEA
ncbi:cellular nucleic acid-binding protein-like [Sipha flava]|uniref:Cellular nucleic acid-binding protein-like n=1 Tax=Sipha flava TaxID=143950 RepID=A0A8B8GH41_9HEMI|nr:cellular nucleic acid-binding protein-like [Sipha flava]